jgi:3-oxoacyl-[acyl-carrier-protein] synthase II
MSRSVYITGLGPISGLGLGKADNWAALCEGKTALSPVSAFDASTLGSNLAGEVKEFKIGQYVPKSYRKATKVMARDIELAVAAADYAAHDAGLVTKGTDPEASVSYASDRVGCHIGAGLIAADLDELGPAFAVANGGNGDVDLQRWGKDGMSQLTPLWLLKYLPNMLACHVTIIHDAQGPSNTITCGEASGGLSIGESLRVIQRGQADLCFCGGAESKLNPMAFYRQVLTGRLVNDQTIAKLGSDKAVRPFDANASGGAIGEGGGIVTLEAEETFKQRAGEKKAYAKVLGFGASQTVNREKRNLEPDAQGLAITGAIKAALREAKLDAGAIDFIVPFGLGCGPWDRAERAAMVSVFGDRLAEVPVLGLKANTGNLGAGSGGYELAIAAQSLHARQLPPIVNRDSPLPTLGCKTAKKLDHALVFATSLGGQNTAMVLGRV